MEYRLHISIRRRGKAPFNDIELKTEDYPLIHDIDYLALSEEIIGWIDENITADIEAKLEAGL